jgi:hypothetical protein
MDIMFPVPEEINGGSRELRLLPVYTVPVPVLVGSGKSYEFL